MTAATTNDILIDAFSRIGEGVHKAVRGLGEQDLAYRPAGKEPETLANSISWLVWHLTRVQDSHIAELIDEPEVWTSRGWHEKSGLPFEADVNGYGHSSSEVDMVRLPENILTGYYDSVQKRTLEYLATITDSDYSEIVDPSWDPPVTRSVRLVSVINDCTQHVGQANYVRGLLS